MDQVNRLVEFETRLIAQEHRLFSVLQNFFVERPKWPPGDPRRDAAAKALLWCMFFSPTTIAVTGGLIGLATLAVLVWQNTLIVEQNAYFQTQLQQQQVQIQAQDRVATQSERTNAIHAIYGPQFSSNPRIKAEAVRSLVVIERSRINEGENVFASDYVNLHDADLRNIHIENFDLKKVSFRNSNLQSAVLAGIDLTGSAFRFSNLTRASFYSSNLSGTFWDSAILQDTDFSSTNLEGANMVRADLRGADLDGIENWQSVTITGAKVHSVKNAPAGFMKWAKENGADIGTELGSGSNNQ